MVCLFLHCKLLMIWGFRSKIKNGHAVMCSKELTGDALDCPPFAEWKETVLEPLLEKYQPDNIYNAKRPASVRRDLIIIHTHLMVRVCGSKHYNMKDKLSLMLCTNMTGTEKLLHLVIGKVKYPFALKKKGVTLHQLKVIINKVLKA